MKKVVIILLFVSLFINDTHSQKIYGFADNYFGSFDLADKTPDTLIIFSGNPLINSDFRAAIDRFNGRYFFGGYIPGHSGNFHIITLGENSIDSYYFNPTKIEYDFIRNRLVYEANGNLYSLNLETMQVSFLGEIEDWNSNIFGQIRTYIPQTNQYFYKKFDDPYVGDPYFLLVNGTTAAIDCQVMVEEYNGYHYSPSGFVTNNYSGEIIGHRNGRYGIVNPCEGTTTKLSTIPDYNSHLNKQMAVFNHQDSTYVIPYYSDNYSEHFKYAIVDVYADQILETFNQPWNGEMDYQQIYDKPIAPLIFYQDTLFVPFGNFYKWYRNDSLIGATNENYWVPQLSGYFKAEIEFRDYITFSTEMHILTTSINRKKPVPTISIHPNPIKDHFQVTINNSSLKSIQIVDLVGRVHYEKSFEDSSTERIEIANVPKGMYCLFVKTRNEFYTKTIIIQ